jgi:hypothetical protein
METQKSEVSAVMPHSQNFRNAAFLGILALVIAAAIVRSAIATSLDSFTVDEAYHIGAGVSYVRTGDFRLNPEHPPLVKIWVGTIVSALGYDASPIRPLVDKNDERDFVETDVYFKNDPESVRNETRTAMFAFNGILLFIFGLAVRRLFGELPAIGTIVFLAIDPTVAAHLPVVMTDLPVALLSATTVLLCFNAFRTLRPTDIVSCGVCLGLTLGTKHSAIVTFAAVGLIGVGVALWPTTGLLISHRLRRLAAVLAVMILGMTVLWSLYLFRFNESPISHDEQFNRPTAEKISDVRSPLYHSGLDLMLKAHVFPRAYIWGLADTIRAGAEGRVNTVLAFGNLYYSKGPNYYFPGVIVSKLPIGLILLVLIGGVLIVLKKIPAAFNAPLLALAVFAGLFLLVLLSGSTYGGIRHAMPIFPFLAIVGSMAIYGAVSYRSSLLKASVVLTLLMAVVSSFFVMRPWEYFNEAVGGPGKGYLYFNDEGVDLSLRKSDLRRYFDNELRPAGEVPFILYPGSSYTRKKYKLDWVGRDDARDAAKLDSGTLNATFIISAKIISPRLWWDAGDQFRAATPAARMGNLMVYKGTFDISFLKAGNLYYEAIDDIYSDKPNTNEAIDLLTKSAALDPKAFFVSLELGNQYLKLGNREAAIEAYKTALANDPAKDEVWESLSRQLDLMASEPLDQIALLRNPEIE